MKNNQQTENGAKAKKRSWLYGLLSISVFLFAVVMVLIVLAVNGMFANSTPTVNNGVQPPADGNVSSDNSDGVNTGTVVSFINPLDEMNVMTEQGFFYNSTLNCYYEHVGIDVSAEAGSEVYAICDGTVESIYTGDTLHGTQITLVKADGVKTVYSFVDPVETLKAGDTVTQGQVIATVSAATGNEYKSGSHLHLEMYVENVLADPAKYLTLSEK